MATITDFGTLKAHLADTLNRDDLTSVIPQFVEFAMADLNRKLRVRQQMVRAQGDVFSGNDKIRLPANFLAMRNIQVNTDPIRGREYATPERMDALRQSYNGGANGEPVYYTVMGDNIFVVPTPDGTYQLEIGYYRDIPVLTSDEDTNFVITDHPDLITYASLMHSAPYLQDDSRLQVWATLYSTALEATMEANKRALFSGSRQSNKPKMMRY